MTKVLSGSKCQYLVWNLLHNIYDNDMHPNPVSNWIYSYIFFIWTCNQTLIMSHNDGKYHQEGVFGIFLNFYKSISYTHRNPGMSQTWQVHHQNITSIPLTEENTSVAYDVYFISDKYRCKTSPRPWPISAYNLSDIFLHMLVSSWLELILIFSWRVSCISLSSLWAIDCGK